MTKILARVDEVWWYCIKELEQQHIIPLEGHGGTSMEFLKCFVAHPIKERRTATHCRS